MSRETLHDLLAQLKNERSNADLVDSEHNLRLDEIVESLEQQELYPDKFDQFSCLSDQIGDLVVEFEQDHPTIKVILDSVQQVLNNFKV